MNLVYIKLKRKEERRYYKTSHGRFQLKMSVINMSKEQCDKLESVVRKACMSILPDKEKK